MLNWQVFSLKIWHCLSKRLATLLSGKEGEAKWWVDVENSRLKHDLITNLNLILLDLMCSSQASQKALMAILATACWISVRISFRESNTGARTRPVQTNCNNFSHALYTTVQ